MVAAVFLRREEKRVAFLSLVRSEVRHRHVPVADAAAAVNALDERAHFLHGRGFFGHVGSFLLRHTVRRVASREAQNDGVFLQRARGSKKSERRNVEGSRRSTGESGKRVKAGVPATIQSAPKPSHFTH